jgi:hypothetical protein
MANLEINASNVYVKLSTTSVADALDTTGKIIVCEESSSLSSSSNVSERKTKCGTITNTDSPTRTISGSGVAVGDLATEAVSAQQLLTWQEANTLLYFAYINTASGTLTQGEIMYMTGTCRVSNVTITSDIGDGVVTFDWELAVTGTVDLTV